MVLAAAAAVAQDHSYTPGDVESGARLYQSSCLGCHGPTGDGIPGVELMHGQFRRATSDAEISAIIRGGIPGTTMPPSGFSDTEAGTIVAYLRSVAPAVSRRADAADAARGNVVRGRTLFGGKAGCAGCHRVNGVGPRVAPDLSDVGASRSIAELQQKILDPDALVRPGNRYVEVVTRDGATISGRLLNYDTFSIQLIDSNERLRSLLKSTVRDYKIIKTSKMPSYRDKLTAEELTDLVSYLFSLREVHP